MPFPVIEKLQGAVNDINVTFETSRPYITGSVKVFRNGLVGLEPLTDGWSELGGTRVRLDEVPKTGDILQVYYLTA
jgi:hypothetical protein